jgi:hypothetical protein
VGAAAAAAGYRAAFATGAVAAAVGVVVLWRWVVPRLARARLADRA